MNKNILIGGIVILILVVGVFVFNQGQKSSTPVTPAVETAPTEEATPTSEATEGAMKKEEDAMAKLAIEAKNFAFLPATLTVKAGEKITYTNRDNAKHSVTSTDGTSFDTGLMGEDESTSFTAPTKAGTYTFHCSLHPSMKGTLVVQ